VCCGNWDMVGVAFEVVDGVVIDLLVDKQGVFVYWSIAYFGVKGKDTLLFLFRLVRVFPG
jgi:hypothetical protein